MIKFDKLHSFLCKCYNPDVSSKSKAKNFAIHLSCSILATVVLVLASFTVGIIGVGISFLLITVTDYFIDAVIIPEVGLTLSFLLLLRSLYMVIIKPKNTLDPITNARSNPTQTEGENSNVED